MLPVEVTDPNKKTSPDYEVEEGMFEGSQVPGQEYGESASFSRVAFQSLTSKIALRHLEARYSVESQKDLKEIKEKLQKTYASVPDKAVRQAIYVWNSVFDRYGDEGRAWASLYGVMNRRGLKKRPGKKALHRVVRRYLQGAE